MQYRYVMNVAGMSASTTVPAVVGLPLADTSAGDFRQTLQQVNPADADSPAAVKDGYGESYAGSRPYVQSGGAREKQPRQKRGTDDESTSSTAAAPVAMAPASVPTGNVDIKPSNATGEEAGPKFDAASIGIGPLNQASDTLVNGGLGAHDFAICKSPNGTEVVDADGRGEGDGNGAPLESLNNPATGNPSHTLRGEASTNLGQSATPEPSGLVLEDPKESSRAAAPTSAASRATDAARERTVKEIVQSTQSLAAPSPQTPDNATGAFGSSPASHGAEAGADRSVTDVVQNAQPLSTPSPQTVANATNARLASAPSAEQIGQMVDGRVVAATRGESGMDTGANTTPAGEKTAGKTRKNQASESAAHSGDDNNLPDSQLKQEATAILRTAAENAAAIRHVAEANGRPDGKQIIPGMGLGDRGNQVASSGTTAASARDAKSSTLQTAGFGSDPDVPVGNGFPMSGAVNASRLAERLRESEMNVSVRSAELGNVEIHTAMNHERLSAEISLEHSDLRKAIAGEVPALQSKLSQEHGIQATIEVRQQGQSFAGGGQHPNSHSYHSRANQITGASAEPAETLTAQPVEESGHLDIRV
jgi:hypothetical protein